jgi:hypothetical protein
VSGFEAGRTIAAALREGAGGDDQAMRRRVESAVLELLDERLAGGADTVAVAAA